MCIQRVSNSSTRRRICLSRPTHESKTGTIHTGTACFRPIGDNTADTRVLHQDIRMVPTRQGRENTTRICRRQQNCNHIACTRPKHARTCM